MMNDPSPQLDPTTEKALFYGKAYAIAFAVLYILCILLGVAMLFFPNAWEMGKTGNLPMGVQGIIFIGVSIPLLVLSLIAAFAPRKKWGWTINFVIQAIGTTGCCCMPLALPMLLRWMKPDVKAAFGAQ